MGKHTVPSRLRKLKRSLEKQGWSYDTTRSGHPRFHPPPGATDDQGNLAHPVTFSKTPSDSRGDKNSIAQLRRFGAEVSRL